MLSLLLSFYTPGALRQLLGPKYRWHDWFYTVFVGYTPEVCRFSAVLRLFGVEIGISIKFLAKNTPNEGEKWLHSLKKQAVVMAISDMRLVDQDDRSLILPKDNTIVQPEIGDKIALGDPDSFQIVTITGSRALSDRVTRFYYRK